MALLHAMPRAELAESFRPRLEHRLFHLVDGGAGGRPGRGSATPVVTVLGMAILLTAVAWSPTMGSSVPEVELPAIVVSGPPMLDPPSIPMRPVSCRFLPVCRPLPVCSREGYGRTRKASFTSILR